MRWSVLLLSALVLVAGCRGPTHARKVPQRSKTESAVRAAPREPLTPSAHQDANPKLPNADQMQQARLAVAAALAAQGHDREAILAYQLALKTQPQSPDIAWKLAVLHD